jgi:hypothetical protein
MVRPTAAYASPFPTAGGSLPNDLFYKAGIWSDHSLGLKLLAVDLGGRYV